MYWVPPTGSLEIIITNKKLNTLKKKPLNFSRIPKRDKDKKGKFFAPKIGKIYR